jgi:hypothetical protein
MENTIRKIIDSWNSKSGVELQAISEIENKLDIRLPEDYKTFLSWSNGGEGEIGDNYISLWKVEDLIILNHY